MLADDDVDLVPVVSGRRPVGVILMTDVFDTVAGHMMEAAGSKIQRSEVED